MKTVAGVFESARDAEHAIDELVSRGFDAADISLFSAERAIERGGEAPGTDPDEPPVGMWPLGVATAYPGLPPAGLVHPMAPVSNNVPYTDLNTSLDNLGLDEELSRGYRRAVERGGTLVCVQTNDERAPAALAIMRQWNAQELARPE